jgi:hypothetical protein
MKICISKKYRQHNSQNKKDKQHTHKTAKRVTRTPLKAGGEITCSGMVSSSCSTRGTRRVNLVKKVEHIRGHLWNRYSIAVNQVMVATVKRSKWWLNLTKRNLLFSSFLVSINRGYTRRRQTKQKHNTISVGHHST